MVMVHKKGLSLEEHIEFAKTLPYPMDVDFCLDTSVFVVCAVEWEVNTEIADIELERNLVIGKLLK